MLIDGYDTLLLDLDGVVYLGAHPVPGAPAALERAQRHGVRLAYVTNNASRTPAAIAAHLRELGAPASASDVVTSAQAAARVVAEHVPPGANVLVVGGSGLRFALRDQGLRPISVAAESPAAVVQGFAPGLSYGLLAEGALAVRAGALFVASNRDSTLPTGRGEQPGNGALVRVIAAATGVEPIYAGKPDPPLHRESVIRTGARRPLVVGDRLDTDIEGAFNAGVESLLVLTGVATPVEVLTAEPRHRPPYIGDDLEALLQPYPEVRDGTCGGWRAHWTDGVLRLDGDGTRIDGLRAACHAAWAAAGEGHVDADAVKPALDRLG
ncbi:Haloacid Dehalogenase Superfamily Class (subfamily) IIA [Nonomuraea maritima]|uniref:Haloacid Dehalogenase Superfamily Class (Subfamily) IIA n=1 Tax=Nonomuraea maritima TaxID=683260 RepID=A0A1G9C820_9ACTN|nr:HAD-IIA family hydrolase [Nonomuraea maritima]SDK47812.1 Haloacid Dehalogenase Superfamily Class (subfamily) IIA [Nonomuraea maritima]